jgi:hypothetical protein
MVLNLSLSFNLKLFFLIIFLINIGAITPVAMTTIDPSGENESGRTICLIFKLK